MAALLLFLLIPIGCAAWSADLAESRGLSKGAHAALGFLFGPVGVLITALRKPDHVALATSPPPTHTFNPSTLRGCPRCGNDISDDAALCPKCGAPTRGLRR